MRIALEVSAFDWNVVPATITIHLHKGTDTYASKGEIWVDTKPTSKKDESAAMAPARFRALLEQVLGIPNPIPNIVTVG